MIDFVDIIFCPGPFALSVVLHFVEVTLYPTEVDIEADFQDFFLEIESYIYLSNSGKFAQ